MKKTALFAILLVSLAGLASAQTGAGAMWIGGTAGFASAGGDLYGADERSTNISLNPVLNYFVAPNIFIGPALSFDRSSQGDWSSTSFDIGAAVGYTLGSGSGGSMIPFLKGIFQFTSSTTKDTYNNQETESKHSGTNIVLGGGLLFPVAKHAGITVEAGYHLVSRKHEGADKSTSGNIIAIGVGVLGLLH
ncbi:outer membrane beta-barrel protein [bacterium]|nr:outer membrane beta-barrel protein [bacterium]